ncbi:IS5 family transposase [Nocardia sp. NPDC058705]|uniref:IS5 family transposase n=1 Tax=Nocardia sp. NPDC058705 TaxID=3346609 RepID=UPI003680B9A5
MAAIVGDRHQVLTDNQWELLELLLPKSDGRVGRNFSNNRLVVEGMLFRLRTGMPWRDLPEVFGPWQTVWKRHRRYAADGTWDRVLVALTALADATGNLDWVVSVDRRSCGCIDTAPTPVAVMVARLPARMGSYEPADHGIGRSRGGLTTEAHFATDGNGRGLAVLISAGQAADRPVMPAVLDAIAVPRLAGGPPRRNADRVLADKAYSSAANRKLLRSKPIVAVIPQRSDHVANRKRRGRAGGRPPGFDSQAYKGRNVVERAFDKAKHWLVSQLVTTSWSAPTEPGLSWLSRSNG